MIDLTTLREDIYNDFIQEYSHLSNNDISDLVDIELNRVNTEVTSTIDDLNQYLNGNVSKNGIKETLYTLINKL
jgi:hypothetical protein